VLPRLPLSFRRDLELKLLMGTRRMFVWAAYFHWLTLMSAGPFIIDRLLRIFPRGRVWLDKIGEDRLRWIWTGTLLMGLFSSGIPGVEK